MFDVRDDRVLFGGIDDQGAVDTLLLLEPRVAVVPIRAVLAQRESIRERLPWSDPPETHAGNTIHVGWENQPMPVNGRVFVEPIVNPKDGVFSFFEPQRRAGDRAVDGDRFREAAANFERSALDHKI